ncbi:hypothetical protein PF003_g4865 [Phytophthora fragariae]|nr:hypothetical protein PF003_g4865 [Phytophthora fragariae]
MMQMVKGKPATNEMVEAMLATNQDVTLGDGMDTRRNATATLMVARGTATKATTGITETIEVTSARASSTAGSGALGQGTLASQTEVSAVKKVNEVNKALNSTIDDVSDIEVFDPTDSESDVRGGDERQVRRRARKRVKRLRVRQAQARKKSVKHATADEHRRVVDERHAQRRRMAMEDVGDLEA